MELLSQENISDHFLIPKTSKSMTFVGHCSSVIKSFGSNFASIASTLEKWNAPEAEPLQESIMSLDIFSCQMLSHLTNCSKTVQHSSTLP